MRAVDIWEIRVPGGAAGIEVARARIDRTDRILAHALPPVVDVVVRDPEGTVVAEGEKLQATGDTPMASLRLDGSAVVREDIWPQPADIGRSVVLAGGEAGTLTAWTHAPDHSEWRWSIELCNHR